MQRVNEVVLRAYKEIARGAYYEDTYVDLRPEEVNIVEIEEASSQA